MNVFEQISKELNIKINQVENTVKLIDEGNTISFVTLARYRKEITRKFGWWNFKKFRAKITVFKKFGREKTRCYKINFRTWRTNCWDWENEILKEAETLSRVEGYISSI